MSLPPSFAASGFAAPEIRPVRNGTRRLLVSSEGPTCTGKTEFAMSASGPIIFMGLDLGLEGVIDKLDPPPTRCAVIGFKEYETPPVGLPTEEHIAAWKLFFADYKAACANPDVRSIVIDTASEMWVFMRLAAFGKLTQVPQIKYTQVNQDYRTMIRMAYDAGVNLILTHTLKKHYVKSGDQQLGDWDGTYERTGYSDGDYLIQVQIRHYRTADNVFGFEILKCRQNPTIIGQQLEGDMANFQTLAQIVHPDTTQEDWA